jgi:hypothetical protein
MPERRPSSICSELEGFAVEEEAIVLCGSRTGSRHGSSQDRDIDQSKEKPVNILESLKRTAVGVW